jgi:hypothetical protein
VPHTFAIVNISSAIFDRSAPDLDSCPDASLPEFAFIGRSNVGKSSLLNMLAGKRGLARVSPTPVFLAGAVLGKMGRDTVLKLSAAWGGLAKHKPLVEAALNWLKCASPKLVPPEDRLAIGGGHI